MKKFRYSTVLILLTCLIAAMLLFTACNDGSAKQNENNLTNTTEPNSGEPSLEDMKDIEYGCALQSHYSKDRNPYITSYFDSNDKISTTLISTKQALDDFCNERSLPVENTNSKDYRYDFAKKINEYDEEFFEKASIIIYFEFEEIQDVYNYSDFQISDELININLAKPISRCINPKTSAYIFEINKKYLKEDTQIKINKIENNNDYDVKIYDFKYNYLTLKKDCPYSFKINSKDELDRFCNAETSPFFNEYKDIKELYPYLSDEEINSDKKFQEACLQQVEIANRRNDKLIELLNAYGDDYFQNKSLILSVVHFGDTRYYRFKDFEIQDNTFNITLSHKIEPGYSYPCVVTVSAYFIEIDKEKVADISQINVTKIQEEF